MNKKALALWLILLAGLLLRVTYVHDMEYKEDEAYNFTQSQAIGSTEPWPWVGIPSGVYLVNPGMSVWVYAALARVSGAKTPLELATAEQIFSLLGICMILPFAFWFLKKSEQEPWLWAYALAMVNPFLIYYDRKLWPEPFLPFFSMLMWMGWWRRDRWGWAFCWGLLGACLGQIHMSGFFLAAALFLWTVFFDSKSANSLRAQPTQWVPWLIGSTLGALPLIPWLHYILTQPVGGRMSAGIFEAMQLKFWVFWITDPTGLHIGNPLGLLLGQSALAQLSDFARYPLIFGRPTYGIGVAHAAALVVTTLIFWNGAKRIWIRRANLKALLIGRGSSTAFIQQAGFLGCGAILTLTGVWIRRYYLAVTFPLEFIWLARMVLPGDSPESAPRIQSARRLLMTLFLAELLISAGFVWYIHTNHGSLKGDYGPGYHVNFEPGWKD